MNKAARQAIEDALSNVEDNLFRYSHFGNPWGRTANGETYGSIVTSLEKQRNQLKRALAEDD